MPKVILDDINGGYSLSKINANFQKIEDELNGKVLYRDNSQNGTEDNTMRNDLDLNGNDILNVRKLQVSTSFEVAGIDLSEEIGKAAASATEAAGYASNAQNTLAATNQVKSETDVIKSDTNDIKTQTEIIRNEAQAFAGQANQSNVEAQAAAEGVQSYIDHVGKTDNPHGVTKAQVGLGNVDNTSDANKPISTATQTALNTKAALAIAQSFTGRQRGVVQPLTDAPTIAVDLILSNHYSVTIAGNRVLGSPTNVVAGHSGTITVTQDATGNRTLSFGSVWKFENGEAASISIQPNSDTVLAFYVISPTKVLIKSIPGVA